jgi:LmbE family N-acetylglucosaminyl deacetylase
MPSNLPVPDATGIYGFAADLIEAHDRRQREFAMNRHDDVIEIVAPATGQNLRIRRRVPTGSRVTVAIEPHNDDLILSAGGTLLEHPRPLVVITVFSQSNDVHPLTDFADNSVELITALRTRETAAALLPLAATHHTLGYRDASKPYRIATKENIDEITTTIRNAISAAVPNSDYELIAPASVSRHPDHLAVHEAAIRLGCRTFWDDTAFYPTYAASFDDRHLFELRFGNNAKTRYFDITECVLDKLTLLYMYQSQMQPQSEMYRAIRYNWTVASVAHTCDDFPSGLYAERFFETDGATAA